MNISKTKSICTSRSKLHIVDIETDVSRGLFFFHISGNVSKSISESKSRILSSLRNCRFDTPNRKSQKVIILITPKNTPKDEGETDLAIIISYLCASNQIFISEISQICCIGSVSINGDVYSDYVSIEQILFYAWKKGIRKFIIPQMCPIDNFNLKDLSIHTINNISELRNPVSFAKINNLTDIYSSIACQVNLEKNTPSHSNRIEQIDGLDLQKRALQIALSGNHHILFTGQPGTGKTALLQCVPELLDSISLIESDNFINKHTDNQFTNKRKYIELHPNTTPTSLLGNDKNAGIIRIANNGVITLNELCEFNKKTIECLRVCMDPTPSELYKNQPKSLNILICASSNNCPCGKLTNDMIKNHNYHNINNTISAVFIKNNYLGEPQNISSAENQFICKCNLYQIEKYQSRISEPVIDRFPIICNFSYSEKNGHTNNIRLSHPKELVSTTYTKAIHQSRYLSRKRNNGVYNQTLSSNTIMSFGISENAKSLLELVKKKFHLSHRKTINTLRVARTIADLDLSTKIDHKHITEAVAYTKTKPFS